MENNEFEKVETKKKKSWGFVKSLKKHALAKIVTFLLVLSMSLTFAGCVSGCNPEKDDPSTDDPGIVEPLPDEPDDPVIDPDDPVIDPDDPVIDPDPENPGEDIPPEDVPPEDIPPEDVPPDDKPPEDNPGEDEDQDDDQKVPTSIDKVDEVDEINYFADEFTQILNDNYLDDIANQLIYINNSSDFKNAEWMITNSNNNDQIKELQVKLYHDYGTTRYFTVGQVTFNQACHVSDLVNGTMPSATFTIEKQISTTIDNIKPNTALGKTVIQTIDTNNTLEGDIWCSIGTPVANNGIYYSSITVYQITNAGVQKYTLRAEASTVNPKDIITNIQEGKYTTKSQSTEYTFAGEKIEQTNEYSQNLANYNYDFDDDIELC